MGECGTDIDDGARAEPVPARRRRGPWGLAAVLLLLGAGLAAGGGMLVALGGSCYYGLAGVALLASGIEVARGQARGWTIYAGLVVVTVFWALAEVGLAPWELMPRVLAPAGLALWFAMPWTARRLGLSRWQQAAAPALLAATLALLFAAWRVTDFVPLPVPARPVPAADSGAGTEWTAYGGDDAGQRYVPVAQIDRGNARDLVPAWTFHARDTVLDRRPPDKSVTFQVAPIKLGDNLYFCTPDSVVFAIDADSGRQVWRADPRVDLAAAPHLACRGLAFHRDAAAAPGAPCQERLLMGTADNRLLALDRRTGRPCAGFGTGGFVDLSPGLGAFAPGMTYVTSPPTIVGDVAVVGALNIDNQSTRQPPGVVRGFDVRSGKLLWAWDVLRPEPAAPLRPGEHWPLDSPNVWSVGTADPALGLVYLPTGNSPPDFFGGVRSAAQDRYSSSVVALDARTGAVRWSFQTVHHDVWDYDIGAQPTLVDLVVGGRPVRALIVATKRGAVFLLDRVTGKPVTGVVERRVPGDGAPGERLSPTQPYAQGLPSFEPARLTERAMWGATPLDQLWCRIQFRRARYDGPFTPPSVKGSIVHPGSYGVIDWGGVAVDPRRGIMIVNTSGLPFYARLIPRAAADAMGIRPWGEHAGPGQPPALDHAIFAQAGTPFAVMDKPFLSPLGFPCHAPPWGTLAAVDLATGRLLWRRPLGTTRDVAPLGLPLPMGVFNAGGSVITSGGVIFVAATIDNYLRAFDVDTGAELWAGRLPAGGQANPISYRSARTGRQYVVVAAGGHGALRTQPGDALVAFALPPRGR